MRKFDRDFWESRYKEASTGWDVGHASPPLVKYIDQLKDKNCNILIPGAGRGYEAIHLHNKGFKNVTVLDIATQPLEYIAQQAPHFPKEHLIAMDFFKHNGSYNLILEQTFFCALQPSQRGAYVKKMHELLKPNGKLAGLLFDFPLRAEGPPFGGSKTEYQSLFSPFFHIKTLERCYNSIKPRQGSELFFIFEKA